MAYSPEEIDKTFDLICIELTKGRSLRSVLREEEMPASETFFKWVESSEAKTKQYARACNDRAEAIFEDIIDIADDSSQDVIEVEIAEGVKVQQKNREFIERSRLRVDARKWFLSKVMPKKYGEKLDVTSDGEKIASPVINMFPNEPKPETE